jgi:predicted ArsR family transcriptional regulator
MDSGTHVDATAAAVGVPMSEVRHHISNLAKTGVGHSVAGGVVTVVYPAGRTVEDFFVQTE